MSTMLTARPAEKTGPATPMTVAELSALRRNCRSGLSGVEMRHLPTGRRFTCLGTWWGADSSLRLQAGEARRTTRAELVARIAERLGEGTPEFTRAVAAFDKFGIICAADIRACPSPESFDARECVLLSRWKVTCCRPSRAGTRKTVTSG